MAKYFHLSLVKNKKFRVGLLKLWPKLTQSYRFEGATADLETEKAQHLNLTGLIVDDNF